MPPYGVAVGTIVDGANVEGVLHIGTCGGYQELVRAAGVKVSPRSSIGDAMGGGFVGVGDGPGEEIGVGDKTGGEATGPGTPPGAVTYCGWP